MNFAIVIPARKGSKGIKNKNLIKIKNKPLIQYTFDQIKNIKIPKFILSNDDNIKLLAKKNKINSSYLRPQKTSTSKSSLVETLLHFANWSIDKYAIDYLVILQPTSPLRTALDIDNLINQAMNTNSTSFVSISEVKDHPRYMYSINKNKKIINYFNLKKIYNRQKFEKIYRENGSIYFESIKEFKKDRSFINNKTKGFIMPYIKSIDIDTIYDFRIAEILFRIK